MKIHDLAIIFIIIILPISIVLATYTQYQIQTINTQTLYDNKLASATYDTIRAFQLNTGDNKESGLDDSKVRDLTASVTTFRNSIKSTFSLNGYTEDEMNSYIPALVYTLYDGFYIYSPYNNESNDGKREYGLKPYILYSCRYIKGNIDVVITYALDNHISVQGMIGDEYISKDGYLIDNIEYTESTGVVKYNGVEIKKEHTKEYLPSSGNKIYSYIKLKGTRYYDDEANKKIIARLNETDLTDQTEGKYAEKADIITNNNTLARDYYIDAYNFTEWFKKTGLNELKYADAQDTVITKDGKIQPQENVWKDDNTKIFQFNSSNTDYSKNIENEASSFNQHRLAVIRHKIEVNLAVAIANYNKYSEAASYNVFQMPNLTEDEWYSIIHNISLISFLQGLPIGGKIYNGYSIVTNSESKEVVLEQNIYILGTKDGKKEYYKIGDKGFNDGTITIDSGEYAGGSDAKISAGRLNLAFKRDAIVDQTNNRYYFYPIKDYNASYNSVIMQNNVDTYDDIYAYVNDSKNEDLKTAFYTALGRERASMYKSWNDYINK